MIWFLLALPVLSVWFILAIVIGIAAERRQQSFFGFVGLSLVLSPLIGGLLLWATHPPAQGGAR